MSTFGEASKKKVRVSRTRGQTAPAAVFSGEAHLGTGRSARYRLRATLRVHLRRRGRPEGSLRSGSTDKVAVLGRACAAGPLSIWRGLRCASKGSTFPDCAPRRRRTGRCRGAQRYGHQQAQTGETVGDGAHSSETQRAPCSCAPVKPCNAGVTLRLTPVGS